MFLVLLKFSSNKGRASQFMEGHKAWIKRGFDDGVFLLDFSQLGAHARSDWLPPEDEAATIPAVRAVMREAEKVERLRIAEASSASVRNREPPELNEPRR